MPRWEQFEIPVTTLTPAASRGEPDRKTLRTRFFIASAVEDPAPRSVVQSEERARPRGLPFSEP